MIKKIEKNKFYGHLDSSKRSHPNLILFADDENNRYVSASFTHSKKKAVKLPENIDKKDKSDCYVRKDLVVDKRHSYSSKEYQGLKLSKRNKKVVDRIIKANKKKLNIR